MTITDYLCPTCVHSSHDWCNKIPDICEAQKECREYMPTIPEPKISELDCERCRRLEAIIKMLQEELADVRDDLKCCVNELHGYLGDD